MTVNDGNSWWCYNNMLTSQLPSGLFLCSTALFSHSIRIMTPLELRDSPRQQPFEPFRLVMADRQGYDIRHPDLLMIGLTTAIVGLTGEPSQTFFERSMKVDLAHVIRTEPLAAPQPNRNGG
jgi:hypothetical protein